MLHVTTTDAEDFDCVAIRRGRQVLLCLASIHLSKRGASSMNAALERLAESETLDPLDEVC